jgi:hypothetical protein
MKKNNITNILISQLIHEDKEFLLAVLHILKLGDELISYRRCSFFYLKKKNSYCVLPRYALSIVHFILDISKEQWIKLF